MLSRVVEVEYSAESRDQQLAPFSKVQREKVYMRDILKHDPRMLTFFHISQVTYYVRSALLDPGSFGGECFPTRFNFQQDRL